jgi:hypothetical protein
MVEGELQRPLRLGRGLSFHGGFEQGDLRRKHDQFSKGRWGSKEPN